MSEIYRRRRVWLEENKNKIPPCLREDPELDAENFLERLKYHVRMQYRVEGSDEDLRRLALQNSQIKLLLQEYSERLEEDEAIELHRSKKREEARKQETENLDRALRRALGVPEPTVPDDATTSKEVSERGEEPSAEDWTEEIRRVAQGNLPREKPVEKSLVHAQEWVREIEAAARKFLVHGDSVRRTARRLQDVLATED